MAVLGGCVVQGSVSGVRPGVRAISGDVVRGHVVRTAAVLWPGDRCDDLWV